MKKLWWFSRCLAIATALYFILSLGTGPLQQQARAEAGCDTSATCDRSGDSCSCGKTGCNGCFVPNGSGGCGTCFSSQLELE